jgi:ribosomal protein S12 methylthiotransferase accessory factor
MNYAVSFRPNFDIIEVGPDRVLFKSENLTLEVNGTGIRDFLRCLVPLLNGSNNVNNICERLPEYKKKDIERIMQILIRKKILEKRTFDEDLASIPANSPQMELISEIGLSKIPVATKLVESNVAIIGLGAHGAQLASSLAHEGIGKIKCLDPASIRKEDLYLSNIFTTKDIGKSREEALAKFLLRRGYGTKIETSGVKRISFEAVQKLITNCDMAICCMDKGFTSAYYWLNKAAIAQNCTFLVSSLEGNRATVGPMIVPNNTACFMCYRMRRLANERRYSNAIAYERFLDAQRDDGLHRRANLNIAAALVGNLLALEAFKHLADISPSQLLGRVLRINFLNLKTEYHDIHRVPQCPECGRKPRYKPASNLIFDEKKSTNILELEHALVSPVTGIIRSLKPIHKTSSEPSIPFVFTAAHSNFNYNDKFDEYFLTASGKGMTLDEARASALGEAIERYCSVQYDPNQLTRAKYSEIKENAVNPQELVLYSSDQYSSKFPYGRFSIDSEIMWTEGYSLLRNKWRMIPATSAYLDYSPVNKSDFLFAPTSNGIACGSNRTEAIMNGLLEVIERDAFLITWMCKLPMPVVNLDSIIDENIQSILRAYERSKIKIHVNAILLDTNVPTFLAIAIDSSDGEPFVIAGLAAHIDPILGIQKALLEIGQVHHSLLHMRRRSSYPRKIASLMNFHNVKKLEDHAILYTSSKLLSAFNFLLNNKSIDVKTIPRIKGNTSVEKLKSILSTLDRLHVDVIVKELTTSDISDLGLSVFRVIITEFQPIHFGYDEPRLGGKRLFQLPRRLGFSTRTLQAKDLNVFPHPLS